MRTSSADAVIVGGGIIGTSIAYHLAKAGMKKVVLVERNGICSGTSRSCQGGLQVQTKTVGPKLALARESFRLYDHLEEELGCDLELIREGGLIAAFNENEFEFLQNKARELSEQGVNVCCIDLDQAKSIQPNLSEKVCGALWSPEERSTNPLKVTFGFARAAAALGVEFCLGTEVRGVATDGRKVVGVETAKDILPTELVVDAAGVWAPEIARMVNLSVPVVPRRGQLLVTEPMPKMVWGIVLSANYLLSKKMPTRGEAGASRLLSGAVFFQAASGNILMGSTRELVGLDWRTNMEGIREVARQVARVIPAMGRAQVIRAFAGLRPAAPDGMPILDRHPTLNGFIVAAGHEGDGVALAPITGAKIAAAVTGQIEWRELAPFSLARFGVQEAS